ncbi:MAG: hypothetical protein ACTSPW_19920 [Promethearchaeota archaeon]
MKENTERKNVRYFKSGYMEKKEFDYYLEKDILDEYRKTIGSYD